MEKYIIFCSNCHQDKMGVKEQETCIIIKGDVIIEFEGNTFVLPDTACFCSVKCFEEYINNIKNAD